LVPGRRTVLNAARHDEKFPWRQHDIAISRLDGELPAQYQEELVGVGVLMPGGLALDLNDPDVPDVVAVDLGNLRGRSVPEIASQHLRRR
jgi:hypothetical protein